MWPLGSPRWLPGTGGPSPQGGLLPPGPGMGLTWGGHRVGIWEIIHPRELFHLHQAPRGPQQGNTGQKAGEKEGCTLGPSWSGF